MVKPIVISRARLHNLKDFDLTIPKDKLVVVTGVSGSGKSSLAFDLLFETGRRQYLQAIGILAAFGDVEGFDNITGLSPTVAVKQGIIRQSNPRSVVGTQTRLLHYLGQLYANEYNRRHPVDQAIRGSYFSFNSPMGMCLECHGRGHVVALDLSVLLPRKSTTLKELYNHAKLSSSTKHMFKRLPNLFNVDLSQPFKQLPKTVQNYVLYGQNPGGKPRLGLEELLQYRLKKGKDVGNALSINVCPACQGFRISEEARRVKFRRKHIGNLAVMTIRQLADFLELISNDWKNPPRSSSSLNNILLKRIQAIVAQLMAVKLDYLSLYRPIPTLSGGESQRLFLMSYLTGELESLLYVFDEPTAGLHETEKQTLLDRLHSLQNQGNAVIIVEHDARSIASAEHVIDMGPLAGEQGGQVVYQGSYKGLLRSKKSITGQYLSGKRTLPEKSSYAKVTASTPKITLTGVTTNNLKTVNLSIPLGMLVGVAGVSGSGKSSLISDTLVRALQERLESTAGNIVAATPVQHFTHAQPIFKDLSGLEKITRCVEVAQEPIGRRSNSNPASYLGIWDRIRKCFAASPQARKRGLSEGHFSFNAKGACEFCKGSGQHRLWLGNAYVSYPCTDCKGLRYKSNILSVRFADSTITDILAMSCEQALPIFAHDKPIARMLDVVIRTGMGYIKLGQPTSTLSGGEAQRLKLAREIGKHKSNQHTLYVLDEPTTGLSLYDAEKLLALLQELIAQGHSVIVIEHDPKVLAHCDWIIETGPGAGHLGGKIIGKGSPLQLSLSKRSKIGPYLTPVTGSQS